MSPNNKNQRPHLSHYIFHLTVAVEQERILSSVVTNGDGVYLSLSRKEQRKKGRERDNERKVGEGTENSTLPSSRETTGGR